MAMTSSTATTITTAAIFKRSDVVDSDDGDDGGHLDEDRQMKPLPRLAPKTEVIQILGEVISS